MSQTLFPLWTRLLRGKNKKHSYTFCSPQTTCINKISGCCVYAFERNKYLFSASLRSEVPKVSSHPLPLMEETLLALGAVNVYFNPFSSISFTSSGNSSIIFSVTLKLGTKGVSPPSGGGISQKSITFLGYSLIW